MSLLDDIKTRGYWHVAIRPARFDKSKIKDMGLLVPILRKTAVQLRGWDYPHVDDRTEIHRDVDWVGQEFAWSDYREIWHFYQSGQFLHIAGALEDWHGESGFKDSSW